MKSRTIKTLPEIKIELQPSKLIPGEVGLFSTRILKKDSIVLPLSVFSDVYFMSWEDFKKLDKITQRKVMDYCPGTEEGFYTPKDYNNLTIGWHMNHSCNPNIGFDDKDNFVAMRTIKKGEELTWDYGFDETNPDFEMKCTCGVKGCRKVVRGTDWQFLIADPKKLKYVSRKLKALAKKQSKK